MMEGAMPETAKGTKIREAMEEQYGEAKGKKVFYASKNAGTITGVDMTPQTATAPSGLSTGIRTSMTVPGGPSPVNPPPLRDLAAAAGGRRKP